MLDLWPLNLIFQHIYPMLTIEHILVLLLLLGITFTVEPLEC